MSQAEHCATCYTDMVCAGNYMVFDPRCVHCGARYIQRIKPVNAPRVDCTAWRKQVLADYVAQGFDEQDIRAMVAKRDIPTQPAAREFFARPAKSRKNETTGRSK